MWCYLEGERPLWEREGASWPNREISRFVEAGRIRWHVQISGEGPPLLLLHGTGAASHSWRDLIPDLATDFQVVAPDLPGHGFTDTPTLSGLSLPGMAAGVSELLHTLDIRPALVVGHSAGAAILIRMALDGRISPAAIISLNGALLPFGGDANPVASSLAKVLFLNPFAPRLFAWTFATRDAERLIERAGSSIEARGLELYRRLASRPSHVGAALGMMANWDLVGLNADLPQLKAPLLLVVGSNDRAISPDDAARVLRLVPNARIAALDGLGHLAHEEDPAAVAGLIRAEAAASGTCHAA